MRKLKLTDPIVQRLPAPTTASLAAAGYDPAKITIADLMTHRAGLRDYATTQAYIEAVGADPGHTWTPAEQVAMTMAAGPPLSAPNTDYAYSDAGYVLIGEIIRRTTGQPLSKSVPDLVGFKRLGLTHTYWEPIPDGLVAAIPASRAHAYQDGIDTSAINPSFDIHGGGGLVSTAGDLMNFFQALLQGKVFAKPGTLASMQGPANRPVPPGEGKGYGLGIGLIEQGGVRCWGHNGHWGTAAYWCPARKSGFVMTINAAGQVASSRAQAIFKIATDMATAAR
jgi:D-alanyl-D-alanine carboxypeptidase